MLKKEMDKKTYRTKPLATHRVRYRHEQGCSVCGGGLDQCSTASRNLVNLDHKALLSIQVSRCTNEECTNYGIRLKPAAYLNQIVPNSSYGVDVYGLIGHRRWTYRNTVPEIHACLSSTYPHIFITERHVENIVNDLELYVSESGKNSVYLRHYFEERNQKNLVLAVDGIEPEKGHCILYIVREVLSGKILFACYSSYGDTSTLKTQIIKPVQALIEKAGLQVGAWIADKEMAMGKAILEVYPDHPFQHCQSHFLSAMKQPLIKADAELGKAVKKNSVAFVPLNEP